MKTLLQKIANLPVGAIATMVGLATLSNVYATHWDIQGLDISRC